VSIPLGGFVSQFGLVSVPLEEVILEMIGNYEGYEGQFSFTVGLLLFSLVFDGIEGILKSQSLDTAAFYCKYIYKTKNDIIYIITTLIGLIGVLSSTLQMIGLLF